MRNGAVDKTLTPNFALRTAIEEWRAGSIDPRGFKRIDLWDVLLNVSDPVTLFADLQPEQLNQSPAFAAASDEDKARATVGSDPQKTVFRAIYTGRDVAVLVMKEGSRELEPDAFTKLGHHPHILSFWGASSDLNGNDVMITELAPLGRMDEVLQANFAELQESPMLVTLQLEAMKQICSAMVSVVGAGLLHCDLVRSLPSFLCMSSQIS